MDDKNIVSLYFEGIVPFFLRFAFKFSNNERTIILIAIVLLCIGLEFYNTIHRKERLLPLEKQEEEFFETNNEQV